jgi:predicted Zn-dependent protease
MLTAYLTEESLKVLEARLPEDAEDVKKELVGLLEEEPLNTHALFMLARCYLFGDEPNEAKQTLETLVKHDPDQVLAKTALAKICFEGNNARDAIRLLTEVTSARPEIIGTWKMLGDYLKQDGHAEASEEALKQHDMIKSFNDKLKVAQQAFSKGDFQAADGICRKLLQLVPNEVRTLRLLARIARQFQHYEFSTDTLARCVTTRPRDVALGLEYGYSLAASRKYQEAFEQCQRLIELAPEIIQAYDLKAEVLFNLGRYQEAIEIYRELLEVPEKRASRLLHLGKVLKTVGDVEEATDFYHRAIEAESTLGQAYWELADLKIYRFSDDEVASMRQLLEAEEVSALDKALIQFALGKALEDAQQFEESFEHYQAANSGYSSVRPYRYTSQDERFRSFFTEEYFSGKKEQGNDTDAAIFVVGLPRSGSTLLEQILSCHSQVDGMQELDEIVSIARAVNDPGQPEQGQYPRSLENLGADQIRDLAQQYLDYAQPYRQQAPYFVDKAPHNFHHIGLIKTLFPNAKIIDIRRNPMASGWSLYRQFFADSFPFSYDLVTIGKYFNDYITLMDHWHAVLPGQILTVNYEDLVTDFPATVEKILQYCGVDFEEACLDFHLNKRAVATPSSEQVRQPLYSDALEHWKNYEAFLEPLKQTIENEEATQSS